MKTLVVDTILNRQWEFENLKTFDDTRLRRIQDELRDKLSHTSWDWKNNIVTLFSDETAEKESNRKRGELFKEKGKPTHIAVAVKFFDVPKTVRDSQLKRNFTDIGDEYKTLMIPLDQYQEVMDDLENANCKIIGEDYVWQNQEAIQN